METLDRTSPVPLYQQLKKIIQDNIVKGNIKPGEKLTGEMRMSSDLGVSRNVVRQALTGLQQEGYIRRKPGRGGSVVMEQEPEGRMVRFSGWLGHSRQDKSLWQNVCESYWKTFGKVRVLSEISSQAEYHNLLLDRLSSGIDGDVAMIDLLWAPRLSATGLLEPLDSLLETDLLENSSLARVNQKIGGSRKTVAVPWLQQPLVLYYNRSLMTRAGLDPLRPPRTMDELAGMAAKLASLSTPKRRVTGFDPGINVQGHEKALVFLVFLHSFGGRFLDGKGRPQLSSPAALKTMKWYTWMVRQANFIPHQAGDFLSLAGKNRIGFFIAPPWSSSQRKLLGKKFGIARIPGNVNSPSSSILISYALVIPRISASKKEASELIRFLLLHTDTAEQLFHELGMIPCHRPTREAVLGKVREDARVLTSQLECSTAVPGANPMLHLALVELSRALDHALGTDADPCEVMKRLQSHVSFLFKVGDQISQLKI